MVGIGIECSGGGMSLDFLLKSPNGATVITISKRPNQKGYDSITLNGNIGQIKIAWLGMTLGQITRLVQAAFKVC